MLMRLPLLAVLVILLRPVNSSRDEGWTDHARNTESRSAVLSGVSAEAGDGSRGDSAAGRACQGARWRIRQLPENRRDNSTGAGRARAQGLCAECGIADRRRAEAGQIR